MLPELPALLRSQAESAAVRLSVPFASLSAEQVAGLAFSDFVVENLQQHPDWWQEIQREPPQADEWRHYANWLALEMQTVDSEATLMRVLRLFRRRMLVRIAWMQCLSHARTEQSLQQLSVLAEVLICRARDWVYQDCCRDLARPATQKAMPSRC